MVILSVNSGTITEGVVTPKNTLYKTKIFLDDPMNIIGFRRSIRQHTETVDGILNQYFEIGYFMEMLYEGKIEAFKTLKTDELDIDFELFDFSLLKRRESDLVSLSLVDNLVKKSKELYEILEDPAEISVKIRKGLNSEKFFMEKLGYNNFNSYLCLRNLMLAENVLINYEFNIKKTKNATLQGLVDGVFSLKAIQGVYEEYMEKIEKLRDDTELDPHPDSNMMNEILLDIRNVQVKMQKETNW